MKYKGLPSEKLIDKLLATSFESPEYNLHVFEWCNEILPHIRFIENERVKLVKKYGKKDEDGNINVQKAEYNEFIQKFSDILNMDISKPIPQCPIKKEWFDNNKCSFPNDKTLWISPAEIGKILQYSKGGDNE